MGMIVLILWLGLAAIIIRALVRYWRFRGPFAKYYAGKHVWIIGASSGLGEEMLMQLAPTGAILSISSRRGDTLELLKKQAVAKYPAVQIRVYPLDVTSEAQIEQTYEVLKNEVKEVDVVIYNSGINQNSVLTHDLTPREALNVLNTNFVGAIHVCVLALTYLDVVSAIDSSATNIQRALRDMKQRGSGHIVTISSLASHRGLPESGIYGASKAAMSNYVESLRVELGVTFPGIFFTDIQPGFVRTPILLQVKYEVPMVMETPHAVELMLKAIKERMPFYSFPIPLYWLQLVSHFIPCDLYDVIIRNAAKSKRAG